MANNFSDFPDNQLTKFRGWSRIFILPLKFLWIAVRSPHRIDAPDRHDRQRDKRTNERTDGQRRVKGPFRSFVCLLDGVWHCASMSPFRRWRCCEGKTTVCLLPCPRNSVHFSTLGLNGTFPPLKRVTPHAPVTFAINCLPFGGPVATRINGDSVTMTTESSTNGATTPSRMNFCAYVCTWENM